MMAEYITRYNKFEGINEVIFMSTNASDAVRVEHLCRQLIGHLKPNEPRYDFKEVCQFAPVDFLDEVACSECKKVVGTVADTQQMKYCPYCGRRRIDV